MYINRLLQDKGLIKYTIMYLPTIRTSILAGRRRRFHHTRFTVFMDVLRIQNISIKKPSKLYTNTTFALKNTYHFIRKFIFRINIFDG